MSRRNNFKRFFWSALVALVGLSLFAPAASAAAPRWSFDAVAPDDVVTTGAPIRIDAWIENVGQVPLTGSITVSDTFPEGIAPVDPEIAGAQGFPHSPSCEIAGQTSICTLNVDGLVPGSQIRFTYKPFVPAEAAGTLVNSVEAAGGGVAEAAREEQSMSIGPAHPFEIKTFNMAVADGEGEPMLQAGSVPHEATNALTFRTASSALFAGTTQSYEHMEDVIAHIPAGLIGNPTALPKCTSEQLTTSDLANQSAKTPTCPLESQVGVIRLMSLNSLGFGGFGSGKGTDIVPLYNMVPPPGVPAAFGANYEAITIVLQARLRPGDNGIDLVSLKSPTSLPIVGAETSFWGVPADSSHDYLRNLCNPAYHGNSEGKLCPSKAVKKPFLRLPTSCPGEPLPWSVEVTTYSHPEKVHRAETSTPAMEGCELLRFDPGFWAVPSESAAGAPSGLDVELSMPQEFNAGGLAQADLRRAEVRLPAGMTINPSSADGLAACSDADLRLGLRGPASCPDASKLGTVELQTPLLDHPIGGSVFLRTQASGDPASGELYRIAIEARSDEDGIAIKLPASLEADPATGRLTSTFEELPQLPFSSLHLHLRTGPRAPLANPPSCGTHAAEAKLLAWSGKAVTRTARFKVSGDGNGGPCPAAGFSPALNAGSEHPLAGAFAPFALQLKRSDADQELAKLDVEMPPGLLASLRGVPYCPEAALAAAAEKSGASEQTFPSCPAASQTGTVRTGAGAGPAPFYIGGKAYLAGPYKGAPLSVAAIVPALAGPFDLGTVVVRSALRVDPTDASVEVVSDPLPRILAGTPLRLRDVQVRLDRPRFTVNPTDCSEMQVAGRILGAAPLGGTPAQGLLAHPAQRFQVTNCAALGFKPKLRISLEGATKRTGYPKLRAVLRARPGDANISRASVLMPRSQFIAQNHLDNICTRVQFAAGACPKGSVYGHARAFSPLLDRPLQGPVYLRSNGGERELPDLVADLRGQIGVVLVGYIDSVNRRLRTRFAQVPDAPVSKFVLSMRGGEKSLLQNSENICRRKQRANVKFGAQNGRTRDFAPLLDVRCGKGR